MPGPTGLFTFQLNTQTTAHPTENCSPLKHTRKLTLNMLYVVLVNCLSFATHITYLVKLKEIALFFLLSLEFMHKINKVYLPHPLYHECLPCPFHIWQSASNFQ